MRYTLVGAVTLGFDLSRRPHGAEAAAVLRGALAVGPREVERLAAEHPGARARRDLQVRGEALALQREVLADVLPVAGDAVREATWGEVHTLERLERGTLGSADGLDHLVRHDLLEWTWLRGDGVAVQDPVAADAADVIVDAAAAHYLREGDDEDLWALMRAPLEQSQVCCDPTWQVADAPAVTAFLEELARGSADAWRAAVDDVGSRTALWAPAMHRATWAMSLTGRLRLAADAQLAAVVACAAAGLTRSDAARGTWNAVAGVVAARLAADLLPDEDLDVLLAPWRRVQG